MNDEPQTHPLLLAIAKGVAAGLSDLMTAWCVELSHRSSAYVVSSDGVKLHLYCNGLYYETDTLEGKRIEISGSYPSDCFGRNYASNLAERPGIGVSANRTPAQIAQDIRRRLLPDVTEHTHKAEAWIKKTLETHQAAEEALARLIAAGDGARIDGHSAEPSYRATNRRGPDYPNWTATLNSYGDQDVSLELRYIPPDLARSILKLVAGYTAKIEEQRHE